MPQFAHRLKSDIRACHPRLSYRELARLMGNISFVSISGYVNRAQIARDIPNDETLKSMAQIIGPRHNPPKDPDALFTAWKDLIALDKFEYYCPELAKSSSVRPEIHDAAISALVEYARGSLSVLGKLGKDERMKFYRLPELATVQIDECFITDNPQTSILPQARWIACRNTAPGTGQLCLVVGPENLRRADVYSPGLESLGTCYHIIQFIMG